LDADFFKTSGLELNPTLVLSLLHGMPGGEGDLFGLGKKLKESFLLQEQMNQFLEEK